MKIDMEKPKCRPEYAQTMPAHVGWYMDEPIDPKDMKVIRTH